MSKPRRPALVGLVRSSLAMSFQAPGLPEGPVPNPVSSPPVLVGPTDTHSLANPRNLCDGSSPSPQPPSLPPSRPLSPLPAPSLPEVPATSRPDPVT